MKKVTSNDRFEHVRCVERATERSPVANQSAVASTRVRKAHTPGHTHFRKINNPQKLSSETMACRRVPDIQTKTRFYGFGALYTFLQTARYSTARSHDAERICVCAPLWFRNLCSGKHREVAYTLVRVQVNRWCIGCVGGCRVSVARAAALSQVLDKFLRCGHVASERRAGSR